MIIVGYQGIGKSTMSDINSNVIDLESSIFRIDGKRRDDWYKIYANVASHLSNQGHIVFVSSHKELRDYMNERDIEFTAIFPDHSLKDKWIEKLQDRYDHDPTKSEKNYRALMNAKEHFDETISDLENEKNVIKITDIDYYLCDIVDELIEDHLSKLLESTTEINPS